MRNQNFIYSPSVTNLGGVMQPMDMSRLNYIGPLVATPDDRTVFVDGGGYGTSRAQYQSRLSAAPNLGGGIADIAATFNIMDLFLGRR